MQHFINNYRQHSTTVDRLLIGLCFILFGILLLNLYAQNKQYINDTVSLSIAAIQQFFKGIL